VTTAGLTLPASLFYDFAIAIDINAAKQRDVKYPTEADTEDYSECHKRAVGQYSTTYTQFKQQVSLNYNYNYKQTNYNWYVFPHCIVVFVSYVC